jgi:coenzyme F420 hydrogenase subunit beta
VIEMKSLRNLQYVRSRFGRMEPRVVPAHVYAALEPYAAAYEQAFGTSLNDETRRPGDKETSFMAT